MATKDLIGLGLLLFAIPSTVAVCCLSQRARDAAFFLMSALVAFSAKLTMNFDSYYWYRGTTTGFEYSVIDVLALGVLAGSVLCPRPGEQRWFWPASCGLLLLYFFYACGNVIGADPKIYGLFELSKILRGIVLFLAAAMFVRGERELSILVIAVGCTVCLEGVLALRERLMMGVYRVTGSFGDPNTFSMYLCSVSPLFVAAAASSLPKFVRRFSLLAIAAASLSIVLTLSRAGLPIFGFVMLGAVAFCVSWRLTPQKIIAVTLGGLAIGALVGQQLYLFKARWAHDSLATEYIDPTKFESRGYYLRLAQFIMDDRFFGVGLNNWSYWVSKKYGALLGTPYEDYDDLTYAPGKELLPAFHYAAPAHSLAALTVGELGVPGLVLFFGLIWPRWLLMGVRFLWPRSQDAPHQLGVGIFFCTCGIFLQSLTEWAYRQEPIFIPFHILLGTLAALCWLKKKEGKQRKLQERQLFHEMPSEHEPALV